MDCPSSSRSPPIASRHGREGFQRQGASALATGAAPPPGIARTSGGRELEHVRREKTERPPLKRALRPPRQRFHSAMRHFVRAKPPPKNQELRADPSNPAEGRRNHESRGDITS